MEGFLERMKLEGTVRKLVVEKRWSLRQVCHYLQQLYPRVRGLSLRTIERFCQDKGIHRTSRLDEAVVDDVVSAAVKMVGPVYGRKTMTGLLRSQGIYISEVRVGASLQRVDPVRHHGRRTATNRRLNPVPYMAEYFGHKLHVDQSEKLVMYGVTHVCAVDGFSGKIVAFITFAVKNCVEIYRHLYRPLVCEYGLWDQIRVDHGKEWHLMLFIQEQLAHLRHNIDRAPHLQTTSKLNHCVERIWVEINTRVNYPIKACLILLEERGTIDMNDPHVKFCVSWFSIRVANVGTKIAVSAWNNHSVPGKGIPDQRMHQNNNVQRISQTLLPETDIAVQQMEATGSRLTRYSSFGHDPLQNYINLVHQREYTFKSQFPNFEPLFWTVVNDDYSKFTQALVRFIEISKSLEQQIP